jgi:hypothetical protein
MDPTVVDVKPSRTLLPDSFKILFNIILSYNPMSSKLFLHCRLFSCTFTYPPYTVLLHSINLVTSTNHAAPFQVPSSSY